MQPTPWSGTEWERAYETLPHIVWFADTEGRISHVPARTLELTGFSSDDVLGEKWLTSVVHPDDRERVLTEWQASVRGSRTHRSQMRVRVIDGTFRWVIVRTAPVREGGQIVAWVGTWTDIDELKRTQEELREAEARAADSLAVFDAIHTAAPLALAYLNSDLRIEHINPIMAREYGVDAEQVRGIRADEIHASSWPALTKTLTRVLETGEAVTNVPMDDTFALQSGYWVWSFVPLHRDGTVHGIGIIGHDISGQLQAERLHAVVMDTMLEGLLTVDSAGRPTYLNRAAQQMLGWNAAQLADRPLYRTIHRQRSDGTPVTETDDDVMTALRTGRSATVRDDAFTRADGSIMPVSYSAAVLHTGRGPDHDDGAVIVFRDATEDNLERARVQERLAELSWLGRIREALDDDRLVLFGQPIVPLRDGAGERSEELLLRMTGQNGELVLPRAFLPVAERYGMILEIDHWVIGHGVRRAAQGHRVEINVSAESLASGSLLEYVRAELQDSGADPGDVVFEITETALMRDLDAGERFAHGLAEIGCGLALDDFGVGYGGFAYLKRFPITHLKIDREFVHDLATSVPNRHVVRAICELARAFGLTTVAEGVERPDVVPILVDLGVDFGQGDWFGSPVALD